MLAPARVDSVYSFLWVSQFLRKYFRNARRLSVFVSRTKFFNAIRFSLKIRVEGALEPVLAIGDSQQHIMKECVGCLAQNTIGYKKKSVRDILRQVIPAPQSPEAWRGHLVLLCHLSQRRIESIGKHVRRVAHKEFRTIYGLVPDNCLQVKPYLAK